MARKSFLTDATVPVVADGTIGMTYTIVKSNGDREVIGLLGNVADNTVMLPDHQRDAATFAGISDAVQVVIGQAVKADLAKYTAELSDWRAKVNAASDNEDGPVLIGLLKVKPERPELSDEAADFIAPFEAFLSDVAGAWLSARKHILKVYGSGNRKSDIVWTGTLSSLIGRRPVRGAIAFGRRVR